MVYPSGESRGWTVGSVHAGGSGYTISKSGIQVLQDNATISVYIWTNDREDGNACKGVGIYGNESSNITFVMQ